MSSNSPQDRSTFVQSAKQLKRSACENEKMMKKYTNPAKLSVENSKKIIKIDGLWQNLCLQHFLH